MPDTPSHPDAAAADLERVRLLLQAKLGTLAQEASALTAAAPEPGTRVQYGKRAGDHVAEVADSLARSRTAGELERVEDEVRMALGKLDAGTYGRCEDCGRPIPEGRLEVLPWATRCVDCQSRRRR